MNNRCLYKAKSTDNGEWIEGFYVICRKRYYILPVYNTEEGFDERFTDYIEVYQYTICQCTGLEDKNGKLIYENDITELTLASGEIRHFLVSFEKVVRKVICHPDFEDDVAKVELNAVCFKWQGYKLFPCIDDDEISDVEKMVVVGNAFDSSELTEDKQK